MRLGLWLALAFVASVASGCAGGAVRPPTGTPEPDKFLFERGTEALGKKRWLVAREYFRELIDTYPQTPHRADAKLGIGDTYLGEGSAESYVLALNEFREFLAFYPTHSRAGYAQYKLGMTHFRQMHSADRDQTETREAIKEFTTFVERYPDDPQIEDGKTKLREARDRLSQYRIQRRLPLLPLAVVPGCRRSVQGAAREGPAVHPARFGVLLPRRVLRQSQSAGPGVAVLRSPRPGVRAERAPGRGAEAGRVAEGGDGESGGRRCQGRTGQEGSVNF